MRLADPDVLLQRMLAGGTRALARMMSYAESSRPEHRTYLASIYSHAGKACLIGLTGVPGSGKSTLVRSMTLTMRARGQSVGIVAVDPSTPFTGGAILGDRVRMADLAKDQGVFIRSMATREIVEVRILKIVEEIMRDRIEGRRYSELGPLIDLAVKRKLDPQTAAHKIIKNLSKIE